MNTKKEIEQHEYFATCPRHFEGLLFDELRQLGVTSLRQSTAGVYFNADTKGLYHVCLWTRLANRILKPLETIYLNEAEALYREAYQIPWARFFTNDKTILVDFNGTNNEIRNTQFGAQRVKDAVCDHFQRIGQDRPDVAKKNPDIRINAHLNKNKVVLSLDISGESLHKRGYRKQQGGAPLKENLAASILVRAGWSKLVEKSYLENKRIALIDPMCGSGTFLIEGAMIAANVAPGLERSVFGFHNFKDFDKSLWDEVVKAARVAIRDTSDEQFPLIQGFDEDARVLSFANENIRTAKLTSCVKVSTQSVDEFFNPFQDLVDSGLCICNPPYGERLGEVESLRSDYQRLGQVSKAHLSNWTLAVFTSNPDLGREMRLRPRQKYKLYNGALPAELLLCDIVGGEAKLREDRTPEEEREVPLSEGAQMVFNRVQKNKKRLANWVKKNNIECYRVYDADMPEYAAAIDVYGDYLHVQEYQAPKKVDERKAQKRFEDIVHASVRAFDTDYDHIVTKTRRRNRGKSQYEKLGERGRSDVFSIKEGKARLEINLTDYLDTGLFLDHRPLRLRIGQEVKEKRFLNLFCYTGTATVHAALGGASESVSVDMSNTYLEWTKRNFNLNNISLAKHQVQRADCVQWLRECRQGFDVIMLDPPSFSNSKKTDTVLDIQRDHVSLIKRCMELLSPDGSLYFSNNLRTFKLDEGQLEQFSFTNIGDSTRDMDFERNKKIHQCWLFKHV